MGVLPRGFFAKRGRCICGLKELLLSVNSIQDTVQALATQNIMNTNVHVEKEQLSRSMTTFQDLESIVYIFTALHVAKSIGLGPSGREFESPISDHSHRKYCIYGGFSL